MPRPPDLVRSWSRGAPLIVVSKAGPAALTVPVLDRLTA